MQRFGYFIGAGHGTDHPHRPLAPLANRDVDAEDPGQQAHPREPMRGNIEQLFVERRLGDGRQLKLALRDKQRELLGRGLGGLRRGDDASAQSVPWRENAVIPNGVGTRWRNQGTQPSQETLGAHLGIRGSTSAGLLEVDPDLSVGGARDRAERRHPRGHLHPTVPRNAGHAHV